MLTTSSSLDFIDKEKAKHHAREHIDENVTEEVYIQNDY